MNPAGRSIRVALLLCCLFVTTRATSAQPAGYIAVNGFGDIRQFGSMSGGFYGGAGDSSFDSTGAGGALRIGTFLHPQWSLELGVDVASRETVDVDNPFVIQIYPPIPRFDLQASTGFVDVSTMVGFHPPVMGRLRLGYRAGFSFVRGTYKSEYPGYPYPVPFDLRQELEAFGFSSTRFVTSILSPTVVLPRTPSIQKHNTGALTLGFDAAIDLTGRFSVVPEIRALVFSAPSNGPGVFLIRPGLGVRWKF